MGRTLAGMALATEIAESIHGVPIGHGTVDIVCDRTHDPPRAVEYETSVQYECIRIGESMTIFQSLPIVGVWAPDLLRCPDCEIDALQDPTDGYGGALVEVDVTWSNQQLVLDARDLAVLDYSPVDEGRDPPKLPHEMLEKVFDQQDWGALRRSRLADHVDAARLVGNNHLADALEQQL